MMKRFCNVCNDEIPWAEAYFRVAITNLNTDAHIKGIDDICSDCIKRIQATLEPLPQAG